MVSKITALFNISVCLASANRAVSQAVKTVFFLQYLKKGDIYFSKQRKRYLLPLFSPSPHLLHLSHLAG
jgi:hypothetical protein